MNIRVRIETHYDRELIYPVCDKAHVFAGIAKTKTLTRKTINLIKDLGYTIEIESNQPTTL